MKAIALAAAIALAGCKSSRPPSPSPEAETMARKNLAIEQCEKEGGEAVMGFGFRVVCVRRENIVIPSDDSGMESACKQLLSNPPWCWQWRPPTAQEKALWPPRGWSRCACLLDGRQVGLAPVGTSCPVAPGDSGWHRIEMRCER